MDDKEIESLDYNVTKSRLIQLLQVWRDYYDEIFEVDLKSGSFDSMMPDGDAMWVRQGFAEIEVIIMAEKMVHPDDKEAFREFFDLDSIARRILEGIYVTKLNFRIKSSNDEYVWVKVKNIVPTKQDSDSDGIKFFSCFRRVDDETAADLKYKQELVDALNTERKLCEDKTKIIERLMEEISSPLTAIIGMSALAKTDTSDPVASRERFKMIESEGIKMNRVLKALDDENESEEIPELEFEDRPINKISFGRKPSEKKKNEKSVEYSDAVIPENYAFISNIREGFEPKSKTAYSFAGKRILIAENSKLNAEVLKDLFTKAHAEYDIAENGREAVVKFVANPAGTYDLVLMDTDLAELDGYSATRCIRIAGKDDSKSVPVFAITQHVLTEDIHKAYNIGFNALFSRPLDFDALFKKVKEQFETAP